MPGLLVSVVQTRLSLLIIFSRAVFPGPGLWMAGTAGFHHSAGIYRASIKH